MRRNSLTAQLVASLFVVVATACSTRTPAATRPWSELLPELIADAANHRVLRDSVATLVLDSLYLKRNLRLDSNLRAEVSRRLDARVVLGSRADSSRCSELSGGQCIYAMPLSLDWLPNSVLIKFAWSALPLPACGGLTNGYYWDLSKSKPRMFAGIQAIHGDCAPITPRPPAGRPPIEPK